MYFYKTVFVYDKLNEAWILNPIRRKYIFCVKLNTAVSKQWIRYRILKGRGIWLWMKTREICTESGHLPKHYYSKTFNFWKHCTLFESCTNIVCSRPTMLSFSLYARVLRHFFNILQKCFVFYKIKIYFIAHIFYPNKNLTTVQHVILTHYRTLKVKAYKYFKLTDLL